ncbi:adenylate cyclase [Sinorhizobium meliloti]|uniref:ATP-binding protein n=1 Tax=Rhizobium meliloti TaxID=382 RepID=UPI000FD8BED5|nr:winged helix-turn-helix domain-containing protein [Sinorhizobium meliloti]RVE91917.1 adenylate cyclase [Sinorhizobium meliloti]RVH37817.1 adenylate cyclase [Sinorhizobium meliloti]RVK06717.1 adenylate cyclase [Sinorhizobium meliloti]
MEGQALPAGTAIADVAVTFGPFSLYPGRHVLLKDGEPLSIGSRALEILIALVEQAGELVSKDDLTARAWPNATVEESNLRAQIALLRKVLGDDQTTPRYVVAVPSRGYRFVAPITRMPLEPAAGELVDNNLPKQLTQVIGREEAIKIVEGRFQRFRIVTIVGPGGMGKTTVGIRVAAQLLSSHKDGICFLDLAPITNPHLLPSILASALRLTETSDDPTRSLIGFLRGKRMLIVFDSCEHILEDAARLAETLLREAPEVAILTTSREALRVEGESVYRLPPLDMPPSAVVLTANDALKYPAIRLFVERAASSGSGYSFDDDEAPVVAHICRQLDGIALAIELAAARVEAFGTRGIAELLNDRLLLLTGGRRTALPRHQTLAAMIEWSYGALSAREQTVLRRLAILGGEFGREAAVAVATDQNNPQSDVPARLADLVAKSLVSVDTQGKGVRYRLLDTTRAFALDKLRQEGETDALVRHLAQYLCTILSHSQDEVETLANEEWMLKYASNINNVRFVLDWAYAVGGDVEIGLAVTVAAIPIWYQLSLVDECMTSVQRALLGIAPGERRDDQARQITQLYRALGLSQAFKIGFAPQALAAFAKAFEISKEFGDLDAQAEALWGLWMAQVGMGEYRESLGTAERFVALGGSGLDRFIGDRMLSMTLFCVGDFRGSRRHADLMMTHDTSAETASAGSVRFRFGQSVSGKIQPAQLLWIQGLPIQAIAAVDSAVEAARASGHAISLCEALARWSCPILVHVGDFAAADKAVTELIDLAKTNALGPWEVFGRCWKATLLIQRGLPDRGVPLLRDGLSELSRVKLFNLYNVRFLGFLADGLSLLGQHAEARTVIEAAINASEEREELWCVSELHRLKGDVMLRGGGDIDSVQRCYLRAFEVARRQDAISWELRAATSLARLAGDHGYPADARATLACVYARFTEGFETADLASVRELLSRMA